MTPAHLVDVVPYENLQTFLADFIHSDDPVAQDEGDVDVDEGDERNINTLSY